MSIDQRGRGVPVIRVGGTEVSAIRRRHNLVKGGAISILGALALIVLPGAAPAAAVSDALALAITRPQEQIVANDIAPDRLMPTRTATLRAIQDAGFVAIRTPIFVRRQNRLSMH